LKGLCDRSYKSNSRTKGETRRKTVHLGGKNLPRGLRYQPLRGLGSGGSARGEQGGEKIVGGNGTNISSNREIISRASDVYDFPNWEFGLI